MTASIGKYFSPVPQFFDLTKSSADTSETNILMLLTAGAYLSGHACALCDKASPYFPSILKVKVAIVGCFGFTGINGLVHLLGSALENLNAYNQFSKGITIQAIREGNAKDDKEIVVYGRVNFPLKNQGRWVVMRSVSSLAGAVSCFALIWLHLNIRSLFYSYQPMIRVVGSSCGVLSLGLNFIETRRQGEEDLYKGKCFSDYLVPMEKKNRNKALEPHRCLFEGYNKFEQAAAGIACVREFILTISAFHIVANSPALFNRVTSLVNHHVDYLSGRLFFVFVGVKGGQAILQRFMEPLEEV